MKYFLSILILLLAACAAEGRVPDFGDFETGAICTNCATPTFAFVAPQRVKTRTVIPRRVIKQKYVAPMVAPMVAQPTCVAPTYVAQPTCTTQVAICVTQKRVRRVELVEGEPLRNVFRRVFGRMK